ncbi:MAG: 6-carboxytetrahydropterin synthase [Acidobacteriia bacterium]|nr:6-carboxytetrahydropterin synthase [Terriglobia bacterium]
MFRLTRRYRFSASHRLHSPLLSEAENARIYGKCNNPYGHGHNYILHVSALGPAGGADGRVLNPRMLDDFVAREILDRLDHQNLNCDVEWFEGRVPTSENLGMEICRRLKRGWKNAFPGEWPRFEKVCIEETARNIFEIDADEIA